MKLTYVLLSFQYSPEVLAANGLEQNCPAETGCLLHILAHASESGAQPYGLARRISFSELLGVVFLLKSLPFHFSPNHLFFAAISTILWIRF
jgi:hypothetical protein